MPNKNKKVNHQPLDPRSDLTYNAGTNHSNPQPGTAMSGFITQVEVKQNQQLIIETWGEEFYLACLSAEDGTTFLGLLMSYGKITPAS